MAIMTHQLPLYRSIVKIRYRDSPSEQEFLGSGVLISRDGIILTNNHVVENESFGTAFGNITVHVLTDITKPPTATYTAKLVVRNEEYDLAILAASELKTEIFVPLLNAPDLNAACIEKPVRVVGYPDLGGECLTVTRGVISGFDEEGNLKTDAEINHGNSGGGAFDENGDFLGIPTFVASDEAGKIGYIIYVIRIRDWLSRTLKTGLPLSETELRRALASENINFEGNLDESTRHPRILGKFAAIEMLLKEGAYERVVPQVEYILEKRPRSSLAYHYLGDAYLYLGEYDDAAEAYRRALDLNPYDVPARGNYALAMDHLKRPEKALEQYEAVLKVADNPEQKALAYHNMGRMYQEMNEQEQARKYYRKALDLKPDFALASEHLKELQSDV